MTRQRPSRAFRLAAGVLLVAGGAATSAALWRRRYFTVEVAGDSMQPALEAGDWLLVRRGAPPPTLEAAGRIAVASDPSGRLVLKRVIGLPGESVQLDAGRVHIDGRPLLEPYARGETLASPYRALTVVPADAWYVLGDHRAASTDSRDFGPLGGDRIRGVAWLRYWPPSRRGRLEPPPRHFEG